MTVSNVRYAAVNSVNPLCVVIKKINGHNKESNGNKYLTLVPTEESKDTLKSMKNYGTKSKILLA